MPVFAEPDKGSVLNLGPVVRGIEDGDVVWYHRLGGQEERGNHVAATYHNLDIVYILLSVTK